MLTEHEMFFFSKIQVYFLLKGNPSDDFMKYIYVCLEFISTLHVQNKMQNEI